MKLYYAPGACSLADHIALAETGLAYDLVKVDLRAHRTEDGRDYATVNPKGYVPALELDDGSIVTENIAVLGYIADRAAELMPDHGLARIRTLEATAFISTEIHKSFKPFFKPGATDAEKEEAKGVLARRFGYLADRIGDGPFLLGETLTVADCYLFVMLLWARKNGIEVPAPLAALFDRLGARPAVRKALAEEGLAGAGQG